MAELNVDTSEVLAMASRFQGAHRVVIPELRAFGQEAGTLVQRQAQRDAPRGQTGRLAERIGPPEIGAIGNRVIVRVGAHARSPEGFPYPAVVEFGRGPVVAKRAKVLRFEIGGRVLYRKRVGPAKAQPYLIPAPRKAAASVQRALAATTRRILARLSGGR